MDYILSRWRTSLFIDGKVTDLKCVDSAIAQGSPISPLQFQVYESSFYDKIREIGIHVAGSIGDVTIYKSGMSIDNSTAILSKVLQICHELPKSAIPSLTMAVS